MYNYKPDMNKISLICLIKNIMKENFDLKSFNYKIFKIKAENIFNEYVKTGGFKTSYIIELTKMLETHTNEGYFKGYTDDLRKQKETEKRFSEMHKEQREFNAYIEKKYADILEG